MKLPLLEDLRIMNRRGYTPSVAEVEAHISRSPQH
jgi:hypothetical protein